MSLGRVAVCGRNRRIRLTGSSPTRDTIGGCRSSNATTSGVQMSSVDHDIDANLRRATAFAEQAVKQGAQFVLFPEFMATGSYLSSDTWDSAASVDVQNRQLIDTSKPAIN